MPGKLYELYDGKSGDDVEPPPVEKNMVDNEKKTKKKKRTAVEAIEKEETQTKSEKKAPQIQCKLAERIIAQYEKKQKKKK